MTNEEQVVFEYFIRSLTSHLKATYGDYDTRQITYHDGNHHWLCPFVEEKIDKIISHLVKELK